MRIIIQGGWCRLSQVLRIKSLKRRHCVPNYRVSLLHNLQNTLLLSFRPLSYFWTTIFVSGPKGWDDSAHSGPSLIRTFIWSFLWWILTFQLNYVSGVVVFPVPAHQKFEIQPGHVIGWMTRGNATDTALLNFQASTPDEYPTFQYDAVSGVFVGSQFSSDMPEWSKSTKYAYMLKAHVTTTVDHVVEYTGTCLNLIFLAPPPPLH